jgi:hypothetical protein
LINDNTVLDTEILTKKSYQKKSGRKHICHRELALAIPPTNLHPEKRQARRTASCRKATSRLLPETPSFYKSLTFPNNSAKKEHYHNIRVRNG